jgi:lactate dehydrogenase-like 2-hydroxyacid dehydrogenase
MKMKPYLLLVEPTMKALEDQLDATYTVLRLYDESQKQAIERSLQDIRAVSTGGGGGISNEWIEKLPNLGVIAVNGVGTDRIDLKFARERNVDVATTLGVLTDDVADVGIALMLAVLRNVAAGDAYVRGGEWTKGSFPLGVSPKGKRVGILGLGQIGKAFGRKAEAFGMSVRYWNRSPVSDTNWKSCASPVELAEDSDVLCVVVAATSETQNIVDAAVLKALGSKGYLINIARGAVVDEDALLDALNNGGIAGAGLDVFLNEPNIREEFFTTPNTVLLPHIGSATMETRTAMGDLVLKNLAAFFAGEKPPTTVN